MIVESSQSTSTNGAHTKHSMPAHSRKIQMGGGRNSSIELLRIIAMFMILMHHFIVHNGYDVKNFPWDPNVSFSNSSCRAAAKSVSSSSSPSQHGSS